jgi:lysophospholipase L1-like esterase
MSRPGLSRPALLPFLPILAVQGRQVSRRTPRLPDASGLRGDLDGAVPPHRVVLVGDSVAAGVGVDDHAHTMAGQVAQRLRERDGRAARWDIIARSGADARAVSRLVHAAAALDVLRRADLVVVSVGVNDTKNLNSDAAWAGGLADLLDGVIDAVPEHGRVVALGLPPMDAFPALPRPLAQIIGARARRLDSIAAGLVAARPRVERLAFDRAELAAVPNPFAADGFHPSAALHAELARRLVN